MKTRNTTRLRHRLRLIILTLTLIFTFTSAFSQIYNYTPDYRFNNHLEAGSFKVSSSLTLPDTLASAPLNSVAVNNGIVYLKTPSGWIAINAASVNLTNFLLKSDTASMLAHYMHYTDTASLSNRINLLKSTSFSPTTLVPHDGLYIDGNNIGVYNYNAQWDAKWLQKTLLSSVQPLDQQTLIYNAAKQQAEWGYLGATSNGTSDGNNYLSNLYLDVDSLKASIVGMTGFNIDLSQRFVNKQLLQSYITYVLDSTTKYFDSTYFTGTGTNLNPYTLKHGAIGSDSTIYKTDGAIATNRNIDLNGNTLNFNGTNGGYFQVSPDGTIETKASNPDGYYTDFYSYLQPDRSNFLAVANAPNFKSQFELHADNNGANLLLQADTISFEVRNTKIFTNGRLNFSNLPMTAENYTDLVIDDQNNIYKHVGAGYLSSETDPVALAKTITVNGSTQALSANPTFTVNASAPDNIEFTAGATGKPAAGASTITFTGSIGYKVIVIRGKVQQPTTDMGDSFYATKDINSETLSLGQPLVSGEHILVQFYKPSGIVTY